MNLGNRSSAALADGRPDDSLAAAAAGVPYTGAGSYLLRLALLTAGYFAAGKLGLALAFINASASAVWPPAGIAVGALLALGWRIWPAVAVGSFLVNLTTSGLPLPSLAIASGNTIEALAGWRLMTLWAGGVAAFSRTEGVLRLSLLALAVPMVAATIGTTALVAAGLAAVGDASSVWLTWWLGDAVGIVMFAPLVVLWADGRGDMPASRRPLEIALVLGGVALTAWIIFGNSPTGLRNYPLQFLAAPVLLWPAFRLGARHTTTATTLLGLLAVAGTLQGWGPFVRASPHESLLLLQSFVGTCAILMLAVSAEVSTRVRLEAETSTLNETLEHRVELRTDELSRMHARLAEAQSVAHVGSWEWEVAANHVWWSDELYRIYDVPVGTSITYERFLSLVHPADQLLVERTVRAALGHCQPFSFEHRIVRTEGTERVLQAHGYVVTDAAGRSVRMVGTAHDITERKRAEEQRAQLAREQAARREAEAANRAKDEFLAILSHELRTPLNAALGWARMLQASRHDPAHAARATAAIERNLHVQARLVADMLDTSHILLGTLRLHRGPVDLSTVAHEAVDMIREAAESRSIRFDVDISETAAIVVGDAARLQQVVWNLLSNAVKFSHPGGSIRVRVRREEDAILLAVEDQGVGILPEFLPHIFERFRQADVSATREHGGLGLGLAIARHLVEAHGGTISAANRSAGGAVFTVRLPAAPATASA